MPLRSSCLSGTVTARSVPYRNSRRGNAHTLIIGFEMGESRRKSQRRVPQQGRTAGRVSAVHAAVPEGARLIVSGDEDLPVPDHTGEVRAAPPADSPARVED